MKFEIATLCSIQGCTHQRKYIKTGYCSMHYNRVHYYGRVTLRDKTKCLNGHDLSELGNNSAGRCKKCARARCLKYHNKNKDKGFNSTLIRQYGITLPERDKIAKSQDYKCAICGKEEDKNRRLQLDHDHKTGRIRGLLCNFCNMHLIYTLESGQHLIPKALAYLKGDLYVA